MNLPPLESAHIETSHLPMPDASFGQVLASLSPSPSAKTTARSTRRRFSVPPALMGVGFAAVAIPALFLYVVQPRQPQMSQDQQQKMAMYLDENKQAQQGMVAAATNENGQYVAANLTSADTAGAVDDGNLIATADANLASANVKNKTYAYHLTLAQGFLKKAIDLSKQTGTAQTEEQKQEIKKYLDQSLESANAAIEADAREGAGFLVRARIYKTGSVLDTSLTELSDQDLQISRALGIDSNYLDKSQDIYDLLPTQQASDLAGAPIVADAEDGKTASVSGSTVDNAETGTIVLPTGQTQITVALPSLTDTQSVQVAPVSGENTGGATFIIKNRTAGSGFTIESTQAVDHNVTLEWRIINQ